MKKIILLLLLFLNLSNSYSQTGTWTALTHNTPYENTGVMLLLTDGTVISFTGNENHGGNGIAWMKLTPDVHGSYINGTWSNIAFMLNARLYFSSQIMPNGNVYVAGGEYPENNVDSVGSIIGGSRKAEIYNPLTNVWAACGTVPLPLTFAHDPDDTGCIADGNSEILPNGKILEGPQCSFNWDGGFGVSTDCLIYDPVANTFSSSPSSLYNHDESAWLKLPDSSILFVGEFGNSHPTDKKSNRYIPSSNTWVNDATLPVDIYDTFTYESGATLLLPNGKGIFFGSTGHNAIYTPSGTSSPGTWTAAADFPVINGKQTGQPDAPAAMMVNGKILCAVSPINSSLGTFNPPIYFVEYDYTTNTFTQVTSIIPGIGTDSISDAQKPSCYQLNMLDLPDGNVLVSIQQDTEYSRHYWVYTPYGSPITQGIPTINNITETGCGTYKITGTLFNGISEGAAYGDDWQMATNYPIIRLSNGTDVYYTRTSNWNRIGAVQTGSALDTAQFTVSAGVPAGTYSLVVVANGFASSPVTFVYPLTVTATTPIFYYNQCAGTPVVLLSTATETGGNGVYSYSWSPGNGTSQNDTIYAPGSTTVYTVTVTDQYGCSATASTILTVNSYCCYLNCSPGTTVPSSSVSTAYGTGWTSNPCITITGPGAFTIPTGSSFTIAGCDVAMGAGASIVVENGATLTITNSPLTASKLYACGNMWQGIQLKDGGNLIIEAGSWVEDAIKGVEIQGQPSSISITGSTLNNNLYDIYVDPNSVSPTYNLGISTCTLTCVGDPGFSDNAYLKAPNYGLITNSGVYLDNISSSYSYYIVEHVVIGDYASSGDYNTFSNMNYGVNAVNSGFEIYNNVFENLAGNTIPCFGYCCPAVFWCPTPIGIAVLANTTYPSLSGIPGIYYPAIVGGPSPNQGNTMEECYRGVDITGYEYPTVDYNTMSNTANAYSSLTMYPYPYGDHAVYLKGSYNTSIFPQVNNNSITNFETGIHLNRLCLSCNKSPSSVSTNTITASETSATSLMSSGIIAENFNPFLDSRSNPSPLNIESNIINFSSYAGITLNGAIAQFTNYQAVSISNNTLTILPTTSAHKNQNVQKSGILLENSQNFLAYNNSISATSTDYYSNPNPGSPYRADTSVVGIRSILSYNGLHECNTISYVGQCIRFEGDFFPSGILSNTMSSCYDGLVLESNGIIGPQGGNNNPIGDVWYGTDFTNSQTYANNSDATNSPLYVLSTSDENPTNNQYNYLGTPYINGTTIITTTGTVTACPNESECKGCPIASMIYYSKPIMKSVVENSMSFAIFPTEAQYLGMQLVYNQISEDTTLMDSSAVLTHFYDSAASANMGTLYEVNQLIADSDITTATSLNSGISPSNIIEQNQQSVNAVLLDRLNAGVDTVTSAQYSTLMSVAKQCPLEGGTAVFQARYLINRYMNTSIVFYDSCSTSSCEHKPNEHHVTSGQITNSSLLVPISAKVYPNPANTMLNIESNTSPGTTLYLSIYNALSEQIEFLELKSNFTTISISALPAGIYYYRITDDTANTVKADKFMVAH